MLALAELAKPHLVKVAESHLKVKSSPASSNLAIAIRPIMAIRQLLAIVSFLG